MGRGGDAGACLQAATGRIRSAARASAFGPRLLAPQDWHRSRPYFAGTTIGIPTRISIAIGLLSRRAGLNFQRLKAASAA